MNIFGRFIDDIYKSEDEEMLVDVVKGISNLASHPK